MPLNANLILSGPQQQNDPLKTVANAMALKNLSTQQQMVAEDRDRQNALLQSTAIGPDGKIDIEGTIKNRVGIDTPDNIANFQYKAQQDKHNAAKAGYQEVEAQIKQAEARHQLVAGRLYALGPNATAQQVHMAAAQLQSEIPDLQIDPRTLPQNDADVPRFLETTERSLLGAKDYLANLRADNEMKWKQGQGRDVKEFERDAAGNVIQNREMTAVLDARAKKGAANVTAVGGDMYPGKTTTKDVDEGILTSSQRIATMDNIRAQYRPEFQQLGTRLGASWSSIKSKLGVDLPPEEKKNLKAYSSYKRGAIEQMNQYIKDMTGAAMGIQEAQRLRQGIPDPGQNWYDGDSPEEFEAKLDDVVRAAKLTQARWTFIKKNGMQIKGDDLAKAYPLDKMPSLMNQRGKFLEESIRKKEPGVKDADLRARVKQQLAEEFGLVGN
jgi:hypothetical protein